MNRKFAIAVFVIVCLANVMTSFAQKTTDFESMWKEVEKLEQKDLPRQVLDEVQKIYQVAVKERNFPQMLKAWIAVSRTKSEIDPDSFSLRALPQMECNTPVEQAIYDAVMASAYRAMMPSRTVTADEDSTEYYISQSVELMCRSLTNKAALAAENAEKYIPVITLGEDSRLYGHDLLSVLTRFACERIGDFEKGASLCQDAADFYQQQGRQEAWTLMMLNKLMYQRYIGTPSEEIMKQLKEIHEKSKDLESGADVAMEIATLMAQENDEKSRDERLKFVRWAQEHYADSKLKNFFVQEENDILHGSCNLSFGRIPMANQPASFTLTYSNLPNVKLEIRKYNGNSGRELSQNGKLILERTYDFTTDTAIQQRLKNRMYYSGTFYDRVTLPAGHYVTILRHGDSNDVQELNVTSICLVAHRVGSREIRFTVLDVVTGRPVPEAKVHVLLAKKSQQVLNCDTKGECTFVTNRDGSYNFYAERVQDDRTDKIYMDLFKYNISEDGRNYYSIFSDRAIYRPGQTVHAAVIVYKNDGSELADVVPFMNLKIKLRDANGEEIETKSVRTNEWGTADADFVLPKGRIPGNYTISVYVDYDYMLVRSYTFKVEEYKRPTFDVTAESKDDEREIAFGDSVHVNFIAKTFSGVPVQGAKVKWTLSKTTMDYDRWFGPTNWRLENMGETTTDDEGMVPLSFLVKNLSAEDEQRQAIRYKLRAEITDIAGETHEEDWQIAVSKKGFVLNFPYTTIDLSKTKPLEVNAYNVNRKKLQVSGTYTVYKDTTVVYEDSFATGTSVKIPNLMMGNYRFVFRARDSKNNEVKYEQMVELYNSAEAIALGSKQDKAQADFVSDFCIMEDGKFNEQKPAVVLFAPQEDDVYLYYILYANDKVVERRTVTVGKKLHKISIPYKQEYGEETLLKLFYVRNGHDMNKSLNLSYLKPETNLRLVWKTFRDRLTPGQQEEWVLSVRDANNKVVQAEVMATMYDAALDQLAMSEWNFLRERFYRGTNLYSNIRILWYNSTRIRQLNLPLKHLELEDRVYDELTSFFPPYIFGNGRLRRVASRSKGFGSAEFEGLAMTSEDEALQGRIAGLDIVATGADLGDGQVRRLRGAMAVSESAPMMLAEVSTTDEEEVKKPVKLRDNFAETAFFYPHLVTDREGNVNIQFTLPESLTEWRFRALAHTKDVRYGDIDTTAVARKDFMVQPNMPRFVREGDKVSIVSRLFNQSEKDLTSKVSFRILDEENMQVIYTNAKDVPVAAGKSESVEFEFEVSEKYPLLVCEITAQTENFSDGERNYLPVLSAKKYVTETVPFYVMNGETKTVDLNTLFNNKSKTATQHRMTLEYTANPSWTVIEALEGIKLPEYDNAPSFAASLYSNTMARQLAKRIPGFYEALKNQQTESDSPLTDNEELKDIISKESPWLRDALKEKNQRKELIDFFNEQLISQRIKTAKEKLQRLQMHHGAWSWFTGMEGSYYITEAVCENLVQLAVYDREIKVMLEKGLSFLDQEELKCYKEMKQRTKTLSPSESTLRYLYLWSLMPDRKVSGELKRMRDDYLKQFETNVRALSIYGKTNGACILRAFGHDKQADEFLESAIQYTVTKSGMGRYYATDKAQYSWRDYKIPTHLAAMNAIQRSGRLDRTALLADMQVWLLRQKQSQKWDNPMNTIAAVQFLLDGSKDQLFSNPMPDFTLDGTLLATPVDTTKFLAKQLGYVKTSVSERLVSEGINSLTVKSNAATASSSDISWGAIYAQFNEELNSLRTQSSGELKITRRLMVDGKDLNRPLKIGDKVTVRLTIKADRDMDFVQIRSQHPACFEQVRQLSGYQFMGGLGGYVANHDASVDVFFDTFRKGSVTFDIEYYVTRAGEYLAGIATAQCAYAPEFSAHTSGEKVVVTK